MVAYLTRIDNNVTFAGAYLNMTFEKSSRFNLARAIKNSVQGLLALWRNEKAFRVEIILSLPMLLLMFFLDISSFMRLMLVLLLLFLLLVEALNSAIEAVVDRISLEIHEQSRLAKDMGSAAVGIALFMNIVMWAYAILTSNFFHHLRH